MYKPYEDVIKVCYDYYNVEVDLTTRKGCEESIKARFMAIYTLHYDYNFSISALSKIFYRSTRNISRSCSILKYNIAHSKPYARDYEEIRKALSVSE